VQNGKVFMFLLQNFIVHQIRELAWISQNDVLEQVSYLITIAIVLIVAIISFYVFNFLIANNINRILARSRLHYLLIIAKNHTTRYLSHIVASSIFIFAINIMNEMNSEESFIAKLIIFLGQMYIFIAALFFINKLIWSVNKFYELNYKFAKQYPISSYLKVVIVFASVLWLILIIGFFTNKSPLVLLTGLGATSAFILFIFKDIILGIVASIQVTVTNTVRIGDRISIENKNIDGNVMEIAISTVKIKNTDNTITTIPTYSLISDVVKNWRFMNEAGAKRIKRTISIDINSIKPCSKELLQVLKNYKIINDYLINCKYKEIINLTLYRVYLMDFLKNHPNINQDQVSVIRHLDSGKNGLPLEIYTYTTDLTFEGYEKIQAEIFEYCFSALSRFELKVLQS